MLNVTIPANNEMWNPSTESFITTPEVNIAMEHSLISVSKWESKWKKPYLSELYPKTNEEIIDYFRCMTITQNVDPNVYNNLPADILKQIVDYINDPMTATTITHHESRMSKKEIITSELIYYWMAELRLPVEYEKWHLNRLLTLIEVCSIKKQPPKKMGKKGTMRSNAALNAARRKKYGSTG